MSRLTDMVWNRKLWEFYTLTAFFVPASAKTVKKQRLSALFALFFLTFTLFCSGISHAAPAGINITNTAFVNFDVSGSPRSDSDSASFTTIDDAIEPGLIFDSSTGQSIDGARITLVDDATGNPATVFGDDGVSTFPSTLISGGTVTDSGGTDYSFGTGRFRFPQVSAGTYRIVVDPPDPYAFPSTASDSELSSLPTVTAYSPTPGSRGEAFTVTTSGPGVLTSSGTKLVPIDPTQADILLTKSASKTVTAIGEFLQYKLVLDNSVNSFDLTSIDVIDTLPKGFRYKSGSVRVNDIAVKDPAIIDGRTLVFDLARVPAGDIANITYVVEVTAGAPDGQAVNTAIAQTLSGIRSNQAQATVTVKNDLYRNEAFLIGRVVVNSCSSTGEVGLPNARIYLEDGTYVLTDEKGRWHIDGVKPGSHVVQLDVDSLPDGMRVVSCTPDNSRQAGQPWSKFVDVQGGTLWRVDFFVHGDEYVEEQTSIITKLKHFFFEFDKSDVKPEHQEELNNLVESMQDSDSTAIIEGYADGIGTEGYNQTLSEDRASNVQQVLVDSGIDESRLTATGYGKNKPIRENDTDDGRSKNRRVDITEQDEVTEQVDKITGMPEPPEKTEIVLSEKDQFDSQWLKTQSSAFEIAYPTEGFNPPLESLHVGVKHHPQYKVKLTINGEDTHPLDFQGNEKNIFGTTSISRWKGMSLVVGNNTIEAILLDSNGNEIDRKTREIHLADFPARAEFIPDKSLLVADGKTVPVIAVRFTDRHGYPARIHNYGDFTVNAPYFAAETVDDFKSGKIISARRNKPQYLIQEDGIAYIKLQPTTQSGEVKLSFKLEDNKQVDIDAWLAAGQREWIFVGLAEASVQQHVTGGNVQNLEDSARNLDSSDGRIAFFSKGQILGKWLLTAAYDTDKDTSARFKQTINPTEYYTLYGDNTVQQYDAASSKKLYLRLERERFFALFGDYDTNLNTTEYARYSRSATGLKSELRGETLRYNVFLAEADFSYHRDEIRGDGTSGLYNLSQRDIVENTDKISIEVRERLRSEIVLSTQTLTRYIDYNIDYVDGTVFFRQPIPSQDSDLNPVYIVAEYETEGEDSGNYTGGGRAAYHLTDDTFVGVTAVHEGNDGAEGNLFGVDASYEVTEELTLISEVVTSDSENPGGTDDSGNAYLLELDYESENLDGSAYYREQEDGFGLGQQNASEEATQKYGVQGTYKFTRDLSLSADAYQQENLNSDVKRQVIDSTFDYDTDKQNAYVGARYGKDSAANSNTYQSTQLLLGGSQKFIDNKLTLSADTEFLVDDGGDGESSDFGNRVYLGADYRLTQYVSLLAGHEYAWGEYQEYESSSVGLGLKPWQGAETRSTFERRIDENSERTFANLGMTQNWIITEHWKADFSVDSSQTLETESFVPVDEFNDRSEDFYAYSAAASYITALKELTSRYEYRTSDTSDKTNVIFGYLRQLDEGLAISTGVLFSTNDFSDNTDEMNGDLRFSISYRPIYSAWTVFNRTDYLFDEVSGPGSMLRSQRLVNNLVANYKPDNINQYSFQYGGKYVLDNIDSQHYDGYTDLWGVEYRRSMKPYKQYLWDIGAHFNTLNSWNAGISDYSSGLSVGVSPEKNMWITAGYNFVGFRDDDFSGSEYTAQGFYLKFRMKFDQESLKELWER